MSYFVVTDYLLFALLFLSSPLILLCHELGHAIAALILTKGKVTVYVGAYVKSNMKHHLNIGRLEIWFMTNPFNWRSGICLFNHAGLSINRNILIILSGPFTSLLLAALSFYGLSVLNLDALPFLALSIFFMLTIWDFARNLNPIKKMVTSPNGNQYYRDGTRIKTLLSYKKYPVEFFTALGHEHSKDFNQAADLIEIAVADRRADAILWMYAIDINIKAKRYVRAKEITTLLESKKKFGADEYCMQGIVYGYLNKKEECLIAFDKSLQLNPDSHYANNNKGYFLTVWEEYTQSIPYFDRAIKVCPEFGYAYTNRALAKIKTGDQDGGLKDLQVVFKWDAEDSYALRNLGIYYLERGDKILALEQFIKSKEKEPDMPLIEELILQASPQVA